MKNYNTELLAPAGNMEAFLGAIHAGADAVYLGGAKFGARAYADNFTTDELISCIKYAHLFGKKVYLTVNTLMKEDEMAELYDYLAPFYEAGLDAVIVQDLGVFEYIKRNFPNMELHASTQMALTGAHGAAFLKELGASRIVPARELSLKEMIHIKEQTGLEIESFIHGAMCYCYSGQCLFSSILGGRSGNRGRCAQPCRLPFSINIENKQQKECYPLSLKDMCTLEHIGEFMDAGIDSFKIEGRMKKPEYAAGVTAIYRKYIDLKKKHPDKALHFDPKDLQDLTKLYIRSERQDGYYYKQNGADMVTMTNPAYSGSDEELLAKIRKTYIDTPLKKVLSLYASFYSGSQVSVTGICENISVTVTGGIMEPAKNQPMTAEAIEKQLRKLGDTCFETDVVEISTDQLGFYPVKAINELRRELVQKLENAIITAQGLTPCRVLLEPETTAEISTEFLSTYHPGWSVSVTTLEQLQAVSEHLGILRPDRLYVESELLLHNPDLLLPDDLAVYVALPYIMRKKEEDTMKHLLRLIQNRPEITGVLFRNLEEYYFLKKMQYHGSLVSDAGNYIWNKEALAFWQEKADLLTCPIELNRREWHKVFEGACPEKIVYGRLPMMVTANCIAKTSGKCFHNGKLNVAYLTDRYNKKFPVMIQCNYCMNVILNSVPLSLHSKEHLKWYHDVAKRIVFTTENGGEVPEVLKFFAACGRGVMMQPPFQEYTTGHEKRGVE